MHASSAAADSQVAALRLGVQRMPALDPKRSFSPPPQLGSSVLQGSHRANLKRTSAMAKANK